jgi:hypothetical protein
MDQQAKNEIRIFKMFSKLTPYSIDINSIKKEKPPEPDISCNLSDGTKIAFELVECIDDSIARSVYDSRNLKEAFYDKLKKLSKGKKNLPTTNFKNASIYIAFSRGVSVIKKRSAIPKIFDFLLTLENTAQGKFSFRSYRDLKDLVRWIYIQRGEFAGPIFDIEAATSFADPAKERIEGKFRKNYEIKCKTELLAYYELQPELPEETWLPKVKEFVEQNISTSAFRRVWIYSISRNKIIFVYPPLES